MKETSVAIAIVTIALIIGINMSVQAQVEAPPASKTTEGVTVGVFSVNVPADWKRFTAQEAATFERQYQQQSREIYQHFSGGSDDPTKSVRVAAYHLPGNNGSFVIVVMSLPPQANLMPMLEEQIHSKMQYGIQHGFIKKYLGMVSVDKAPITGFYTKAIGRGGNIQVSGGLEHSKKKNTIVQLTLLAPNGWKEDAAIAALETVLASLKPIGTPFNAVAAEEYKPVHPKEIACAFKDYNYDGVVAGGGTVKPIGGHIGEFHCGLGFDAGSKKIELAINKFKDGGVATKNFGVIQVRFSSSLTSGGYMLMMIDGQKKKLKAFLAK